MNRKITTQLFNSRDFFINGGRCSATAPTENLIFFFQSCQLAFHCSNLSGSIIFYNYTLLGLYFFMQTVKCAFTDSVFFLNSFWGTAFFIFLENGLNFIRFQFASCCQFGIFQVSGKVKKYLPQTEPSLWQMEIVQQLEILFAYQPNKLKSGTLFACISAASNFTNMEINYETLWT